MAKNYEIFSTFLFKAYRHLEGSSLLSGLILTATINLSSAVFKGGLEVSLPELDGVSGDISKYFKIFQKPLKFE